jgi:hypothetical protein
VVAVGRRGGKRCAGLRYRRCQLQCGQLGDDVAGTDASTLLDLDGRELAADLGRDADLGRPHDTDDWCGLSGAPQEIPASGRRDEQKTKRNYSCAPSHLPASV